MASQQGKCLADLFSRQQEPFPIALQTRFTCSPKAQVASQEGKYLADLFSSANLAPYPAPPPNPAADIGLPTWVPLPEGAAPFEYRHAGSFA